jgi:hypothetical protein
MREKRLDTYRFLGFSTYAFGIPLLLILFLASIDNTMMMSSRIPEKYHPGIGMIDEETGVFECSVKGKVSVKG